VATGMSSFFNGSQKEKETLLKQYIDAQFLAIRLEKLENQASTRELNGSEVNEFNDCVAKYTKYTKSLNGVGSVSKNVNNHLLERAKSLIQGVQDLTWNREALPKVQAARKVIADGIVELARKATAVEKARKAEANPEPGNIPAGGEWVRWWNAELNAEFFQDPANSNHTEWVLPAGQGFVHGDDLSKENPRPVRTSARFQSINPYLVS
jgi:hypothetical protein